MNDDEDIPGVTLDYLEVSVLTHHLRSVVRLQT